MTPRFPLRAAILALALAILAAAPLRAEEPVEKGAPDAEQTRIQKLVDDLRPLVSKIRGLEWKQGVPAQVLSREELRAFLIKELEKEVTPEEWSRDTRILKRLGLLDSGEDLKELLLLMYESSVAGFYNPKTKKLYVIRGMVGDGQMPTIVHELIHALDDQYFDLKKMEEPFRETDPDRAFAIRCLWEGSAEFGRRLFEEQRPEAVRAALTQQAGDKKTQEGQKDMFRAVPAHMVISTFLHYRAGPNFVEKILKNGYAPGMQALFDDPPTTQEQLLHPYKWLGKQRDYPRTITWGAGIPKSLGKQWKKLDEHSVGELDLAMYLNHLLGRSGGRLDPESMGLLGKFVDAKSNRAARGWDAGRALYVENDDEHMVVVHAFAFDTPEDASDAARFLGAARRAASVDDWKGEGWQDLPAREGAPAAKHYDFRSKHGRGRVLHRGREVLVLDGVTDAQFDAAWAAVEKTTFTKDERDKGDEATDPFEGCSVVDRHRGLGLMLPDESWSATKGGRTPVSFATAVKGDVSLKFLVVDQAVSGPGLPHSGRMLLGPAFREKSVQPARLMGRMGLVHPLPSRPGWTRDVHMSSDAARTYVVIVTGPVAALASAKAEISRLLQGLPGPGAKAAEGTATPAGLRSVPGY